MSDATSDFDAAKAIVDQLKGMERDRQERVLRWVAESLGIATAPLARSGSETSGEETSGRDAQQGRARSPGLPSVDIKTFVEAKKPRSDIQFAAVVAYYYRFEAPTDKRSETIDSAALQDAARLVGRARLKKPHMTLNNAKNQGYLDSVSRGQFGINTVGENLVAMTLPADVGASSGTKRTATPKKKRPARTNSRRRMKTA